MPGNFGAAVRRPGCLGMTLVVIRDPGLLGFVGIALLTAIWFLVGPGGLPAYWIEQIGLDLGICWLSRRVARRAGDLNATRRFWRAMSIGGVCFASADTFQAVYVTVHPGGATGVVQPALVAVGVAVVVAAMLTHPLEVVGKVRMRLWLDAVTVLTAVAVFLWYFVVGGDISSQSASELGLHAIVSVMMLVGAFGLIKLLLSENAPFTRLAGVFGIMSATCLALADVAQNAVHGNALLVLQLLPCIMLTTLPRLQEVGMRVRADRRTVRRKRPYSLIPYVAVLATQALLIIALTGPDLGVRTWGVAWGTVTITMLVLSRQLIAFHDNAEMLVRLDASIAEGRVLQQRLHHKATHDPLTGLANRALFDEHVEQHLRPDAELGMLAIDLDDFKQVNDTLGHHVGDALLRGVSARLTECVRSTDTVARFGGDEFAVLLPDASADEALGIADRITAALAHPIEAEAHLLRVTASIGVANGRFETADGLLRAADAAMYIVKQNGKGAYRAAAAAGRDSG